MNLLELYNSIDLERIQLFIEEGKEENLQLDFKEINRADLTHKDDRKNFAKALSGFANSSGGIIIWGVKATKNKEGIDCAQDKAVISNVSLFLSKLNEFTGSAVSPIVDGVLHKSIIDNGKNGFAVTYVPESDSCPHMAKFSDDRYYKRSGDSFYKMEHFDLEDMFGRRKKPSLEIIAEVIGLRPSLRERGVVIMIRLLNSGRGTAKAPYLEIKTPLKCIWAEHGYDGNGNLGLDKIIYDTSSPVVKFGSDANTVIHPSISIPISRLIFGYDENNIREEIRDIEIPYTTTAEDMRLQNKIAYVKKNDLYKIFKQNGKID